MKSLHRYFVVLLFLFIFLTNITGIYAMNTGFSVEELSEKDINTFVSNIAISLIKEEPKNKSFACFDVNKDGVIAIGQSSFDQKRIYVYSSDGIFQYGYTFNCSGNFGLEWDEENLNIYFDRSDVIISIDSDGNILDIKAVQDTIDNNTHRNSLLYSTNRIVGNTTYLIRNDMGILNWITTSYSQVVTINTSGEEHIIYDVNSTQLSNTVIILAFILIFVSIAVVAIVKQFIKLNGDS